MVLLVFFGGGVQARDWGGGDGLVDGLGDGLVREGWGGGGEGRGVGWGRMCVCDVCV